MKINSSKIYEQMSLRERAQMAFKYMLNDNQKFSEILATIPRKTYVGNDLGFSMRSTGLYQTAILWGFEYQKQQGLNTTFLGLLSAIDENTKDSELKQLRNESQIKFLHSRDKLEILFSLLNELDESHGLDSKSVYAIAEVRWIAVGSSILDIKGDATTKTPQVLINHDTKNKNQACKDYYQQLKELFTAQLNQYENTWSLSAR